MILQALKEYYDRKAADPDSGIAPPGFEWRAIPFLIVIDQNGNFLNLEDTREKADRQNIAKTYLVPRSEPRCGSLSYKTTFLLWDHIGYVLRHPDDERAKKQHRTWISALKELPAELAIEQNVNALLKFYEADGIEKVKAHANWNECVRTPSCNITFKIAGDILPVPCSEVVEKFIKQNQIQSKETLGNPGDSRIIGRCLVTGNIDEIVRVHSDTRIGKDAKKLLGFQRNSGYDSYGKEQGYNAPVGKSAESAYTTALNTLLKSPSRMLIGDAVTVCWSERDSELERQISEFFNEPQKDDPDRNVRAVHALFDSIKTGAYLSPESETNKFFVLGLSPNVARIAVRFWIVDTVAGMATKIKRHFDDLRIVHGPRDKDVFSLFRLLISTATQGKSENIPPNLAGDTMRAILEELPYPQTLLQAAVRRIRAEHDITYIRAAMIKACINRLSRYKNPTIEEELKMSLDESNVSVGYRLGRLFAVLERIQQEANPGINTTIRDRFYGAASGTPVAVFGNLMRLKNHHLSKLTNAGRRVYFEKLLGSIIDGVDAKIAFPPHLSLEEQGRFAIGYYHQNQHFFAKK